jgi:hypothetical protein
MVQILLLRCLGRCLAVPPDPRPAHGVLARPQRAVSGSLEANRRTHEFGQQDGIQLSQPASVRQCAWAAVVEWGTSGTRLQRDPVFGRTRVVSVLVPVFSM